VFAVECKFKWHKCAKEIEFNVYCQTNKQTKYYMLLGNAIVNYKLIKIKEKVFR